MRRLLALSAALLLSVATPAFGRSGAEAPTRIQLVSVTVQGKMLADAPPKGLASAGDRFSDRSRLLNAAPQFGRKRGAVVGSDSTTWRYISATTIAIRAKVKLPGGTLTIRGRMRVDDTPGFVLPVIGGSGAYARARGTITVGPLPNGRASNVYRLTYPAAA
jgi:hypothetical protein